jgi:hypothetical protein
VNPVTLSALKFVAAGPSGKLLAGRREFCMPKTAQAFLPTSPLDTVCHDHRVHLFKGLH